MKRRMFDFFRKFKEKRRSEKLLLKMSEEAATNLEIYYVIQQINRWKYFHSDTSCFFQEISFLKNDTIFIDYKEKLHNYNQTLNDYLVYQKWYLSDIKHQSKKTARNLEKKNENIFNHFEGLEKILLAVQQRLLEF